MNLGTLNGGEAVNVVPHRAVARVDFRVRPGLDVNALLATVNATLAAFSRASPARITVDVLAKNAAFRCAETNALCRRLVAALEQRAGGENVCVTLPYTTDGTVFKENLPGADVIVFGPGSVAAMHAYNEYVDLDALVAAAAVLADVLAP